MRTFTRATAVPKMNTSSVSDVERFIIEIQAWPMTSELRVSCQATGVSVAGTLVAHPHSVPFKAAFYKNNLHRFLSCFSWNTIAFWLLTCHKEEVMHLNGEQLIVYFYFLCRWSSGRHYYPVAVHYSACSYVALKHSINRIINTWSCKCFD